MGTTRFLIVRPNDPGNDSVLNRLGAVICVIADKDHSDEGLISVGVSVTSARDNFCAETGKAIAYHRAMSANEKKAIKSRKQRSINSGVCSFAEFGASIKEVSFDIKDEEGNVIETVTREVEHFHWQQMFVAGMPMVLTMLEESLERHRDRAKRYPVEVAPRRAAEAIKVFCYDIKEKWPKGTLSTDLRVTSEQATTSTIVNT